ncbi:MAG: FoF1 ATP synthase subunit gamma [Gammaproteobacteria bacterium]
MTKRRDLEHHRDGLQEIGEILSSMKTLAYMETRKLGRFLSAQQKVVASIREIAEDLLGFYPELRPQPHEVTPVFLLIGSERGFCGDFNRALTVRLAQAMREHGHDQPRVVTVGHKLRSLLEGDKSVVAFLDGASVAEEVPAVLQNLIDELNALQTRIPGLALFGVFHDDEDIDIAALLPPFEQPPPDTPSASFPPLLNVTAEDFLRDLVDHYLFAALNNMLYASLMAENQRRVSHLEGAVRHLEQESGELTRKCRALRQEEIVEEIEVILLSAVDLDTGDR